jgi:hypothetical protein
MTLLSAVLALLLWDMVLRTGGAGTFPGSPAIGMNKFRSSPRNHALWTVKKGWIASALGFGGSRPLLARRSVQALPQSPSGQECQ